MKLLAAYGLSWNTETLLHFLLLASSEFIDLRVDFSRALINARNGFISLERSKILPFLIVLGLGGTYSGKLILKRT